jgi:hypothetical protein
MDTPTFTEEQKEALSRLGLFDQQIKAVELVLPTVQALLRQSPTLTDVREHLGSLRKSLANAAEAISKLAGASTRHSAEQEAWWRLQAADFALNRKANADMAGQSIAAARRVVERALEDLSREQRRHRAAHPLPVFQIDRALHNGFVNAHAGKRFRPYLLKPSASPNSVYRRIIAICYEAVGAKNSDPERAVKAFISQSAQARDRDHPSGSGTAGG